jgi:hypothetical protein
MTCNTFSCRMCPDCKMLKIRTFVQAKFMYNGAVCCVGSTQFFGKSYCNNALITVKYNPYITYEYLPRVCPYCWGNNKMVRIWNDAEFYHHLFENHTFDLY